MELCDDTFTTAPRCFSATRPCAQSCASRKGAATFTLLAQYGSINGFILTGEQNVTPEFTQNHTSASHHRIARTSPKKYPTQKPLSFCPPEPGPTDPARLEATLHLFRTGTLQQVGEEPQPGVVHQAAQTSGAENPRRPEGMAGVFSGCARC